MSAEHNVIVRKASVNLMAGETIHAFTRALEDAGRKAMKSKLGLGDKDSVCTIDVYPDKAVFDVYKQSDGKYKLYMCEYKRDATKGIFSFDMPKEVKVLRQYVEANPVKKNIAGEAEAEGEIIGWVDTEKGAMVPVSKPYPNEHAARQTNPGKYDSFRRGTMPGVKGVSVIYGISGTGPNKKSEIQSLRFDAKVWTADKAKAWLKDHNFKTAGFEAAAKPKKVAKGAVSWDGIL